MSKCRKETVVIKKRGKIIAKFSARKASSGCKRRRNLVWGAKAKAHMRAAKKSPEFKAYRRALPAAARACKSQAKPFTKKYGACVREHMAWKV